jgi:hypothetical protein
MSGHSSTTVHRLRTQEISDAELLADRLDETRYGHPGRIDSAPSMR